MSLSKIRLILVFLFLVIAIVFTITDGFQSAWYVYLASFILLLTHFLFGSVWSAFSQLKKGKLNEAEDLLHIIKRPQWLLKTNRAYYYFTKGMIALQRKQLDIAKLDLTEATKLGLRTDNDYALVHLNLAHIAYVQQDFTQAAQQLSKAKSFPSNDLMIKENIDKMEKGLQHRLN